MGLVKLTFLISLLAVLAQGTAINWPTFSPKVTLKGKDYACKCYQGDNCWPSASTWSKLNATVDGNLQSVTPIGSVCFKSYKNQPSYNAEKCTSITANNGIAAWVVKEATQVMWPYYSNNTCDPGGDQKQNECSQGYYPDYVILAKTKEHVIAGINFARESNIRLVIRNTGHDFMGRSIGRGSLAINTQSFQDISFIDKFTSARDWNGGAVTVGAGVMFRDLYPKAFKRKVVVVGGECPTVGIAGGHGPLSGYLGLAADNVLSFDVITADGDFVTANAKENTDLFWALKGGGPSTFGVVISMTVKTHPEVPSIAMLLNITGTGNMDRFWKGVTHFRKHANQFSSAGMYVWYSVRANQLTIQPVVAPNFTRADFDKVTQPLIEKLRVDEIDFKVEVREFRTFYELYDYSFAKTDDAGAQQSLMGGRLIVQEDITNHGDELATVMRRVVEAGNIYAGHVINPGVAITNTSTSVHSSWYKASSQDIYITPLKPKLSAAERKAADDYVSYGLGNMLRDASPKSASYVNEGDINEPEWQNVYWGENYPELLRLKREWDPKGVFYAKSTPGTEEWSEILDGKLCRKV